MKTKKLPIIIGLYLAVLALGLLVGLVLLRQPDQDLSTGATGGAVCPPNGSSCSWSYDKPGVKFKVTVIDQSTGQTIIDTTTTDKLVTFTPEVGRPYKCTVTPVDNVCGNGPSASTINTCLPRVTDTPTPSPTKTPTPTVTPTGEPSVTPTATATPTPTPTTPPICEAPSTCRPAAECSADGGQVATGSCSQTGYICCRPPDVTPTATPTATPTPTATATPSPTPTATPTPTTAPSSTPTATPTPTNTPTPIATNTPGPTWTPQPTWTPAATFTPPPGATFTPTPTEIIIAVNNTSTPTPTQAQATGQPEVPQAGVPVAWFLLAIPLAILMIGLVF